MGLIYPSASGWITARSEQGKITTQNSLIILPQKIDKVNKVLLHLPNQNIEFDDRDFDIIAKLSDIYFDEQQTTSLENLDVSKYIVEKENYYTLQTYKAAIMPRFFNSLYTNNTWYYEHNGTKIVLVNDIIKGNIELDGMTTIANIISSAVYGYLYNDGKKDGKLYFYSNGKLDRVITYSDRLSVAIYPSEIKPDIRKIPFRVYYTPLGESVKLQVPKTNPQPNQFCIPYSQQQPIVDNVTLGREMQSVANRAGCEKREVVRTFGDIKDYRDPNDHWYYEEQDASGKFTGNVWRLTGARLEIYRENMYRVVETWSKNWSYRSENVPINREFRSWNIPADIVQRNLLWQDYCLITRKTALGEDLPNTCLLTDDAKQELMRGFDGSASGKVTECNNMWLYNRYNGSHGVALSCSSFGFGNSLVFSGKTKDNLSAGVQRVKSKNDDSNYEFCKDVYYCKENGTLDDVDIQIGSVLYTTPDPPTDPSNCYPESMWYIIAVTGRPSKRGWVNGPAPTSDSNGILLFKEYEDGKQWNTFKVLKDPSEQLNFTYQLHLLTDDGYLLIGSTLAANNPLVKERGKAQAVKVWKLSKYLPQGAQVMTSAYGTELQNSDLYSVSLDSNSPSITFNPEGTTNDGVGVCVTDENNAILIAFNGNKKATFDVKFTHDYDAIAQALKKQNN